MNHILFEYVNIQIEHVNFLLAKIETNTSAFGMDVYHNLIAIKSSLYTIKYILERCDTSEI